MTDQRMHDLDVVRTIALMMGIVFHGALSFMPIFIGWAVMDVSTSDIIPMLVLISHAFRMPLFFMLAGFFVAKSLSKTGVINVIKHRLIRIGIPFILGWMLLRPLLIAAWIAGSQDMQGDIDWVMVWQAVWRNLAQLPDGLLIGTHLWFLYYLLMVTVASSLLYPLIRRFFVCHVTLVERWQPIIMVAVVMASTAACIWFMPSWSIATPDKSLVPVVPVLLLYSLCFWVGIVFQQHQKVFFRLTQCSLWSVLCLLGATLCCLSLAQYEGQFGLPHYMWIKLAYSLCYAALMWLIISNLIGVCRRYCRQPSKLTRYFSDAAYGVYLLHLPVVIFVQISVSELPLSWWLKLPLVFIVSTLISLGLYDVLIRATWIGHLLSGQTKPSIVLAALLQGKHRGTHDSNRMA